MIKTDAGGKTKIICDRCGYTMEFLTPESAWVYLGGRGRIYGWHKYCGYDEKNILYCPVCHDEIEHFRFYGYGGDNGEFKGILEYKAIEDFERFVPVEFNKWRERIQMRLEMFQY